MPDQHDADNGGEAPVNEPLPSLIKTYIDQQIKKSNEAEDRSRKKKWKNSWRSASPITKGTFVLASVVAIATVGYSIVAGFQLVAMHGQLIEMQKSTKTAQEATYASCLSAQTAQNMFIQSQGNANDSHAMVVATIQQAAAQLQSERADLVYLPRLPEQGDVLGHNFDIVETFENIGRGDARSMTMKYWAVLARNGEHLRLAETSQHPLDMSIGYFPAGKIFPEKAQPPHGQLGLSVELRDSAGKIVANPSVDARDLVEGKTTAYVYGTMNYSDITGFHSQKFCKSVWVMQPNTRSEGATSENDVRCAHYNRGDTEYSYKPLPPPQALASAPISNIACAKPNP